MGREESWIVKKLAYLGKAGENSTSEPAADELLFTTLSWSLGVGGAGKGAMWASGHAQQWALSLAYGSQNPFEAVFNSVRDKV